MNQLSCVEEFVPTLMKALSHYDNLLGLCEG